MTDTVTAQDVLLGVDVGSKRVGLALARGDVRIASPFATLERTEHIFDELLALVHREAVTRLVVGLPRGLDGQATAQTIAAEAFAQELAATCNMPLVMQDEALTSVKAEKELAARGKPYAKGDVDALAATYILEDYLHV